MNKQDEPYGVRRQNVKYGSCISALSDCSIGLKTDGTIVIAGEGRYETDSWKDIVAVCDGGSFPCGLLIDGTVVSTREDNTRIIIEAWRDIISISDSGYHIVGLKADGSVIATGDNDYGQCNTEDWRKIVAVTAGGSGYGCHTVGLYSDGTVTSTGSSRGCVPQIIEKWHNIVAISAGGFHTVGLRSDGTVVVSCGLSSYEKAPGLWGNLQSDTESWRDIVAISAGFEHIVGLKSDGTAVAVGENKHGKCKIDDWFDIVAVSAGQNHTLGLKSNGTVVAAGIKNMQCDTQSWENIGSAGTVDTDLLSKHAREETLRLEAERSKRW